MSRHAAPGTALNGLYGTLTLNADGSYSYVLDNSNADANGNINLQITINLEGVLSNPLAQSLFFTPATPGAGASVPL